MIVATISPHLSDVFAIPLSGAQGLGEPFLDLQSQSPIADFATRV